MEGLEADGVLQKVNEELRARIAEQDTLMVEARERMGELEASLQRESRLTTQHEADIAELAAERERQDAALADAGTVADEARRLSADLTLANKRIATLETDAAGTGERLEATANE